MRINRNNGIKSLQRLEARTRTRPQGPGQGPDPQGPGQGPDPQGPGQGLEKCPQGQGLTSLLITARCSSESYYRLIQPSRNNTNIQWHTLECAKISFLMHIVCIHKYVS